MPRKRLPAAPEIPRIHPDIADKVVPIDSLHEYHRNPNIGDVPKIAHSLRNNGQFKTITVNVGTYTGRPNEILAGNHTWKAAKELGWVDIARSLVDVDEQTAARIVADDNHTAELAKRDPEKLAELLGFIAEDDLAKSTFTDDELAKLLGGDDEGDADVDDEGEPVWGVIITCRDEAQQLDLIERLAAEGHDVRAMVR